MPTLFEPLKRSAGVLYGSCGGVWVMLMFAPPVLNDMVASRPALQTMSDRFPDGFPTLTWVLPSAGLSMDGPTRKMASTVTMEFVDAILDQATLIEGAGFQSATVRAIISGIDMVTRSKAPKKVFGDLRHSIDWCLQHRPASGEAATGAAITAALEVVRKTFG